jgi:hypothetical protein
LIETKQKYNTRDDGTSKQDFLASVSIEWWTKILSPLLVYIVT